MKTRFSACAAVPKAAAASTSAANRYRIPTPLPRFPEEPCEEKT
jgi:hypothetical protein